MNTTPTLDKDFSAALRAELVALADASPAPAPGQGSGAAVTGIGARPRRGRGMRFALVAASVAAGLMVATALLPGTDRAYAGWSGSPTPLTGAAADSAAADCAAHHGGPGWQTAVAERRGSWTLTMLRGEGDALVTCHARDGRIGLARRHAAAPRPEAGEITVLDLNGVASGGEPETMWPRPWEGHYVATGRAGEAVAAITLHTTSGEVTASLANGTWVAWWPLRAERDWEETLSATVTLHDGSTRTLDRAELDALHEATLDGS